MGYNNNRFKECDPERASHIYFLDKLIPLYEGRNKYLNLSFCLDEDKKNLLLFRDGNYFSSGSFELEVSFLRSLRIEYPIFLRDLELEFSVYGNVCFDKTTGKQLVRLSVNDFSLVIIDYAGNNLERLPLKEYTYEELESKVIHHAWLVKSEKQ